VFFEKYDNVEPLKMLVLQGFLGKKFDDVQDVYHNAELPDEEE
jgi:hypothetical protein